MRAYLHRFLLMLLMLTLPLQALAGVSMLDCAFSHQAAVEQVAMADEMMAGCHESERQDAPSAQHNCKHCAACALASVLPMPVTDSVAIAPVQHRVIAHSASAFSGFVPDGPERPPRTPLA